MKTTTGVRWLAVVLLCILVISCCASPVENVSDSFIADQFYSVYKVQSEAPGLTLFGTAMAVKLDYHSETDSYYLYLLTARHNIDRTDITSIDIINMNHPTWMLPSDINQERYHVITVYKHETLDAAILVASINKKVPIVSISLSVPYKMEQIYSFGIPFAISTIYTQGHVSNYDYTEGLYMTDAFSMYGGSGGGVFDRRTGKLIGIICEIYTYNEGPVRIPIGNMQFFLPLYFLEAWLIEKGLYEQRSKKAE